MRKRLVRTTCSVLIACVAGLPLAAQAELIGTGQAVAASSAQGVRAQLGARMEALGVEPGLVAARIDALTDREVLALSKEIDSAPAGASGLAIGMLLVVIFLIWRFNFSDQAKAEAKAQKK